MNTDKDPILNIVGICCNAGIKHAIVCPGSRSALLTVSFARHPLMNCKVIFDERSAAYIALGMAQRLREPVVLICTSGTAALNFAPAISEAFYQHIPLIVLTADRPPEWLNQQDGQMISQRHLFHNNVKQSYSFPTDRTHPDSIWAVKRILNEAIHISNSGNKGPVHINVPIREPFYEQLNNDLASNEEALNIHQFPTKAIITSSGLAEIKTLLNKYSRKIIVAGHNFPDEALSATLSNFLSINSIPFIADINSNLQNIEQTILFANLFLPGEHTTSKDLEPELIISFGNEVLSKSIKTYLRSIKVKAHLHIQLGDQIIDPFQSVTHLLTMEPDTYFVQLNEQFNNDQHYFNDWQRTNASCQFKLRSFLDEVAFSELSVVDSIINQIPDNSILQLANSLSVRYANIISSPRTFNYCNRGTSGIDGCVSTAVGSALADKDKLVYLIIGDTALQYDRNGFWHNYLPTNLRIVVLNNAGGGIFRTLSGANALTELEDYFVTKQNITAELTAKEFGIEYTPCYNSDSLKEALQSFNKLIGKASMVEVFTDSKDNAHILNDLREYIK